MLTKSKTILLGSVGKDPEMRYTGSGKAFTTFSVAHNREFPKADGTKAKETDWYPCIAWGKLAEIINQYVHQGSKVYLEGEMRSEHWEKDGVKMTSWKLHVDEMSMLDDRNAGSGNSHSNNGGEFAGPPVDPEDIPF